MKLEPVSLAERRAGLVALIGTQRRRIATNVDAWRGPLAIADRGLAAFRFVKTHPAWIVGAAIVPAALPPGRLGLWLRRGLAAIRVFRGFRDRGGLFRS